MLSYLVADARSQGFLHGIKLSHFSPANTSVFFIDNTLLFARATHSEATHLLQILHLYASAMSQSISFHKSQILFSRHTPLGLHHDSLSMFHMLEMEASH